MKIQYKWRQTLTKCWSLSLNEKIKQKIVAKIFWGGDCILFLTYLLILFDIIYYNGTFAFVSAKVCLFARNERLFQYTFKCIFVKINYKLSTNFD